MTEHILQTTPDHEILLQTLRRQEVVVREQPTVHALREHALAQAPTHGVQCHWLSRPSPGAQTNLNHLKMQHFDWMGDSDTRLGPLCEVVVSGAYRWLPFSDIASMSFSAPQRRLDLIWRPVKLTLRNGQATADASPQMMHVFIPARSCWQQAPIHPDTQQLALLQARLTVWEEYGRTGVFCLGQKIWMSDGIDWPVLDLRELHIPCSSEATA